MKLSYNWLKEYVNTNAAVEVLAKGLTMSGSEVEAIENIDKDKVMDLEITSNRPDCLNIIGLAREISAVFGKNLSLPDMDAIEDSAKKDGSKVKCVIKNKTLCPHYTARVISDVSVSEVEGKMQERLKSMGLRSVNNVVDITNFCLLETGQPLHAFDLDKIKGDKIIIREAAKGEKITTIDSVERELAQGMLVIADSERPIAIAGVMGGKDTEVTTQTKNILLESAYFDPASIRQTARILGLSSDSSYRFERGVSKDMVILAQNRAATLISKETGGKICGFYSDGRNTWQDRKITFDSERAGKILGITLDVKKVKSIFEKLGLTILEENDNFLRIGIPAFREDLEKEIDLVEEVARIHGYHNISADVASFSPHLERKEHSRQVIEKLYEILPAMGLSEIMTYSLISASVSGKFPCITRDPVELSNPISEEHKVLTPQLVGGMLKTISWNLNRKNSDLGLFEIGKIYSRPGGKGKIIEKSTLCVGLTGALRQNWREGTPKADIYSLKGVIETSLQNLKLQPEFYESIIEGLANGAEVRIQGEKESAGFLGEVAANLLDEYDIAQPVHIAQINLDNIIKKAVLKNRYQPISRFPLSTRDVSILCDVSLSAENIHKTISEVGEELVCKIKLTDVYEGKQIDPGKKSLTYSIQYGLHTRTLTDEEVESIHSKIKDTLTEKLNVSFR